MLSRVLFPALAVGLLSLQTVDRLYKTSDLEQARRVYLKNLQPFWSEDLLGRLSVDERARAGEITLSVPLIGVNDQPLDFYANAERREVFLPISSIKFMDDISIAFAYYDRNSCDVASISDYVAALRFHPRSPASSPLQALGVPSNAIKDSYVDDVAQKTLKSTIYFMAAHEFAHVMYRHAGYQGMTAADAQRHEMEADAFAIDVLRRVGVVPEGLTVLFLVASRLEAGPDDFSTPGDYERYLQQQSTHPTSARRIVAIADVINAHLADFARGQNNKAKAVSMLRADAARLRAMGETLDNVQMRRMLWRKAQSADMTSFRQACHH